MHAYCSAVFGLSLAELEGCSRPDNVSVYTSAMQDLTVVVEARDKVGPRVSSVCNTG